MDGYAISHVPHHVDVQVPLDGQPPHDRPDLVFWDDNGDGHFDRVELGSGATDVGEFDENHDGHVDRIAVDFTGDGRADGYLVDHDRDGRWDEIDVDANGDGRTDVAYYDTNHDGSFDTAKWDSNEDGYFDYVYQDTDQDGVISPDGAPTYDTWAHIHERVNPLTYRSPTVLNPYVRH